MNWAKPEVREHHLAIYKDLLERYDVDGIDLEFRRAVPFFEKEEPEKALHMNEFMRRLRQEADRIGAKRGKHISIAIQCLWDRESQTRPWLDKDPLHHGLDYKRWAREGWVDILIGIVKLTGCRESKPPHRVFRRGFTDDILGLSQLVMR